MRRLAWMAPLLALGAAACGTSDADRFRLRTPGTDDGVAVRVVEAADEVRRGRPTRAEVRVIRGWADALRAGHVKAAARFFAPPVAVYDGTNRVRMLPHQRAVVAFNRALPCGTEVVGTRRGEDSLVLTTLRLTERRGPGRCARQGARAAVAFLIKKRHIVQWLAAPIAGARGAGGGRSRRGDSNP